MVLKQLRDLGDWILTSLPQALHPVCDRSESLTETNCGFFKTGPIVGGIEEEGVFRREQLWEMGRISTVEFKAHPQPNQLSAHQLQIGAHVRYEG